MQTGMQKNFNEIKGKQECRECKCNRCILKKNFNEIKGKQECRECSPLRGRCGLALP